MKISISGHINGYHWGDPSYEMTNFFFRPGEAKSDDISIALEPYTIVTEVTIPDGKALTADIVQALRQQKQELLAQAAQDAAKLDDKINNLLALSYEAAK